MESMGTVVKRYRLPHITYPYSSCTCSFLQQHPNFLFIFYIYTDQCRELVGYGLSHAGSE